MSLSNTPGTTWIRLVGKIGLSRHLLLLAIAGIVLGLFPIALHQTDEFDKLPELARTPFLLLRYLAALVGFVLLLWGFEFWERRRRNQGFRAFIRVARQGFFPALRAIVPKRGQVPGWGQVAKMGFLLFLARRFEAAAYGGEPEPGKEGVYTEFAVLFCVYFELIWQCKDWFLRHPWDVPPEWVERLRKKLQGQRWLPQRGRALVDGWLSRRRLNLRLPHGEAVLMWLVQCALVIMAGILLLYIRLGSLPDPRKLVGPLFWCMLSGLMLSLFFDTLLELWEKEKKEKKEREHSAATVGQSRLPILQLHGQVAFVFVLIAVMFGLFGLFFREEAKAWPAAWKVLSGWRMKHWLYFLGLIVALGTVAAILADHFGMVGHEEAKHHYGERKIGGREWVSVFANLEPLVGVLLFATYLHVSGEEKASTPVEFPSAWWVAAPAGVMLIAALVEFLRMWSRKKGEILSDAFTQQVNPRHIPENARMKLDRAEKMTALLLHNTDARPVTLISADGEKPWVITEKDAARADPLVARLLSDARWHLVRSNRYPVGVDPRVALLVLENGLEWFTPNRLESRAAFDAHRAYLLHNHATTLLPLYEVVSEMKHVGQPSDLDYDQIPVALLRLLANRARSYPPPHDEQLLPILVFTSDKRTLAVEEEGQGARVVIISKENNLRGEEKKIKENIVYLAGDKLGGLDVGSAQELILDVSEDTSADPSKDPYPDAEWILLDGMLLADWFARRDPLPIWLLKKRVIICHDGLLLPQCWAAFGAAHDTPLPEFNYSSNVYPPAIETRNRQTDVQNAAREATTRAEFRFRLQPKVLVVYDSEDKRKECCSDAILGLLGSNAAIEAPTGADAARRTLQGAQDRFNHEGEDTLVLLDNNLSGWGLADTTGEEWASKFHGPDIYLMSETNPSDTTWHEGAGATPYRTCSPDRTTRLRVIGQYLGIRGKLTPWSADFEAEARVAEIWMHLLADINKARKSRMADRVCYQLLLEACERHPEALTPRGAAP